MLQHDLRDIAHVALADPGGETDADAPRDAAAARLQAARADERAARAALERSLRTADARYAGARRRYEEFASTLANRRVAALQQGRQQP